MQRTLLLACVLALAACGRCSTPGAGSTDDAGTSLTGDGGGGQASSGGSSGSSHGGSSGGGGSSGAPCPTYQKRCDGVCIPTVADPDNCGDCSVVCGAQQACSAGRCVDAAAGCLPGFIPCGRECVDPTFDNRHCGGCAQPCTATQGCVDGNCETAVVVGPPPAQCASGGPPIIVGDPDGDICAGNLAQVSFTWALCTCEGVGLSQTLTTDAFDSQLGPYTPGGAGGAVGINAELGASQAITIGGALWVGGSNGIGLSQDLTVRHTLKSNGPVQSSAEVTVGLDAYVNGDVTANPFTAGGALYAPPDATLDQDTVAGAVVRQEVTIPLPCNCDPNDLLDVGAIVEARRTNNDNATIGLNANALSGVGGPTRLDLPCGHFFLDAITGSNPVTIVAHGHVALYVGANIGTSQRVHITLLPTGSLDLFVKEGIGTSAELILGNKAYPALHRTYVGGTQNIGLSSNVTFATNLYAPRAPVGLSGGVEVFGSVFAQRLGSSAPVNIHYDTRVTQQGQDCPVPGVTPDAGVANPDGGTVTADAGITPQPDGGGPGPQCNSCTDCFNQACVNGVCGGCTTSDQCCAPLLCFEGSCQFPPG